MAKRRLDTRAPWVAILSASCLVAGGAIAFSIVGHRSPLPPRDLAAEARRDLETRQFKPLSEPLEKLIADPVFKPVPTQAHPLLMQSAPDFTLQDTAGQPVTLSERLKKGPVVLVFYYGYACDHCVSQLFALEKDLDKFRELGAEVLAVSADPQELTLRRYKQYGAFGYPVLSDRGNAIALKFSTFTPPRNPDDSGELMHGTFVIDRDMVIRWANRGDEPFISNQTLLIELNKLRC